jgi:tetratricopeptide (TPR) repeat protein
MTDDNGRLAAERGRQAVNRFIDAHKQKRRDNAGIHAMEALEHFFRITDQEEQREELRPLAPMFQQGGLEDLSLVVLVRLVALEEALGNHGGVSSALIHIGNVYTSMGNLDGALRYGERALEAAIRTDAFADAASASTNTASLLARQGDFAAALPRLRRSLELLDKVDNPRTEFITRGLLVQVLDELGSDTDEAFAVARPLFGRLAKLAADVRGAIAEMLERIAARHHATHGKGDLAAAKAKLLPELWGTP